ncbi:MAG: response regulator transcription factor [Anaerolineales bacterium]|nr:response regulator transcription factor [Chloroflexota bacterium]MBL7162046.1 response regulator transcription factor [Anaerolineales bacterium]
MVKVLICDDQVIVCEGLQTILNASPKIEVVGTAHDGSEALALIPGAHPDVVLMDLKMPVMNGIIATRKIRQKYPDIRVLVLTTYDDDEWLFDAVRSGASGYLLKDTPPEDLIEAILGTAAGKTYVDPNIAGKLLSSYSQKAPAQALPTNFQLSERETDILELLAKGLSNADIAQQLYLTEGTVRNYTSEIFKKLGVSDRTQAAVLALRYGLVDLE